MGTVVDLADRRAARAAAARAAGHPAMRWVAGEQWWTAHRRDPDTRAAACGQDGPLVLAPPGVPLCPACFPSTGRASG